MRNTLDLVSTGCANYDSFLLRTWQPKNGGSWRWMLESVMTGDRHFFSNLPDLVLFLRDHTIQLGGSSRPVCQPHHASSLRCTPERALLDLPEEQAQTCQEGQSDC